MRILYEILRMVESYIDPISTARNIGNTIPIVNVRYETQHALVMKYCNVNCKLMILGPVSAPSDIPDLKLLLLTISYSVFRPRKSTLSRFLMK